jgi:GT2 family glycosyltransferase
MISVIIPTCNRSIQLDECLKLLTRKEKSRSSFDYEIIVTDDSNEDHSKNLVNNKYKSVRWIEGPKRGPAANRNNGATHAKGEWLIFIDDDCLPAVNIIDVYFNAIGINKDALVFEGCTKTDREQRSFIEESPVNELGGYLWACNFMINKKYFLDNLMGFDEKFPYPAMEDVDLHYRIIKDGVKVRFIKDALVIHPWRKQKEILLMTKKRFLSTVYFLKKHPERKKDINSLYYLRAFYNGFVKGTIRNAFKFKFKGICHKIVYDFMQLKFSISLLIKKY